MTLLGVILVVGGGTSVAYGGYLDSQQTCYSGYYLQASETTPPDSATVTNYTALNDTQQRLFDESVENHTKAPDWVLDHFPGYVRYEGDTYAVGVITNGCGEPGVFFEVGGFWSAVAGTGLLVLAVPLWLRWHHT